MKAVYNLALPKFVEDADQLLCTTELLRLNCVQFSSVTQLSRTLCN